MTLAISRHICYEPTLSDRNVMEMEEDKFNTKTSYNLFIQYILSVGSFHNLTGHILTGGKFAYHKIPESNDDDCPRYYKYVLDDKIYYLESCEYIAMISDFGESNDVNLLTPDLLRNKLNGLLDNIPNYMSIQAIVCEMRFDTIEDEYEKNKLSMNYICEELGNIKKGVYILDLLLNDYLSFLKSQSGREIPLLIDLHTKIRNKISDFRTSVIEKNEDIDIYIHMKTLFACILDLCVEQFPDILLSQGNFDNYATARTITITNPVSFELYKENKIDLKIQKNKQVDELLLKRYFMQPPFDIYRYTKIDT